MAATTLADYQVYDVVDFQRYRADGQYDFEPVERGMVTEITDTRLVVAYVPTSRHGYSNPSRIIYLYPSRVTGLVARYNG